MSVGGKVTEVIIQDERVYIDTDDDGEKCAIFVVRDENSEMIKAGDIVWWQGRLAYWTTADMKTAVERPLHRIGYSGVNRPSYHGGRA